jgi:hypothetical protein
VLDHHFAERHHGHDHVYVGPPAPGHSHPYQVSHLHTHADGATLLTGGEPGDGTLPSGVVYFTSQDGSGWSLAGLAAPSLHSGLVFPDLAGSRSRFGLGPGEDIPPGISVAPPRQPPRL